MPDNNLQNDNLACEQWEAMLAEVIDGSLAGEEAARFDSHAHSCTACAQLLEESQRGQQWLRYLAKEPPVPQDLVAKILAQTTGTVSVAATASNAAVIAMPKRSAWKHGSWFAGLRRFSEPRLMMTAAMAFFSIALTLDLAGVRSGNLHFSDLNPTMLRSTIERQFATASRPVVRYYDHLRFVYEVEARVREFRRTEERDDNPGQQQKKEQQQQPTNHGGSAIKDGVPGKDGGSFNEPRKAVPPEPVVAGPMMEAELNWNIVSEKVVHLRRICFEALQGDPDQAGRSLA